MDYITDEEVKETVEWLEDGGEVTLECGNYTYTVAPADTFIGGDGMEGFISEVYGNVVYNDPEHLLRNSIKYLSEDGNRVEIKF